jgi:hypothetical protein
MRRNWTPRSDKQKWANERCFQHFGSLKSITIRLHQIATANSTLTDEGVILLSMASTLKELLKTWNTTKRKDASFGAFSSSKT